MATEAKYLPVKKTFSELMARAAELRTRRAALSAERNRIGGEMADVRALPPAKEELKGLLENIVSEYSRVWGGPLSEQLALLKGGMPAHEFVERHSRLARDDNAISANGWIGLLGMAMKSQVGAFIDQLDWPGGISNAERVAKLQKLEADLAPISAEIAEIDFVFDEIGVTAIVSG